MLFIIIQVQNDPQLGQTSKLTQVLDMVIIVSVSYHSFVLLYVDSFHLTFSLSDNLIRFLH